MVSFPLSNFSKRQLKKNHDSLLNAKATIEQKHRQGSDQLMFSPFVYIFNINDDTKCLFHSLTLKKAYLKNGEYITVLTDMAADNITESVKSLLDLEFIVTQSFDQERVFCTLADKMLRKTPSPFLSYVLVTDYCNFRCGYCFIEHSLKGPSVKMSKEVADKVINALITTAKEVKEYKVTFYGGEPLSNSEIIFYIIEKLEREVKNKFTFSCVTNGSFVTKELAKKLKENNVSVGLSLDGWYGINGNRVFTEGIETFNSTLRALTLLNEANVNVGISCTITKQNYEYAEEIVDFFHKLGIKSLGFNLFTRIKNSTEFEVPDPKQLAHHLFNAYLKAKKLHMFEDRIDKRRASYFFREIFHVYDCPAFGQQIFFSPSGTVGPCQAFYSSGEYQIPIKDDLKVQDEPLFYKWFELGTLKNKECMNCPALGICGGACAYDVYIKTGQLGIKEDYFCTFQNEILKLLLAYDFLTKSQNSSKSKNGKRIQRKSNNAFSNILLL